jgi:hypothetical protein
MESPQEMRVVAREEEARELLESGVPFEEALDIMLNRYWKESPGTVEHTVEQIYREKSSMKKTADEVAKENLDRVLDKVHSLLQPEGTPVPGEGIQKLVEMISGWLAKQKQKKQSKVATIAAKLLRRGYVEEARALLAEEAKSPRDLLIEFFSTNPDPSDESFHKLAEDNGIEPDKLEAEAYKIATEFVSFLGNGKAREQGFSEEDADPEQLKMGVEVEKEHTTNEDTAKRIALDHLAEIPDYYTRLKKMEDEAKANKGE